MSLTIYDQLGLWGEIVQVKEHTPKHLRCFPSKARLKLKGQKVAIVANPKHPLVGQKVWIMQNKGETVEAMTANGKQVFISPELRPINADENMRAEYLTLRYALLKGSKDNLEQIKSLPIGEQ